MTTMAHIIGAHRHGQKGALAPCGNFVKCFCALVLPAKCSVDEFFTHYFHNLSSASRGFVPTGDPSLDPAGGLSFPGP